MTEPEDLAAENIDRDDVTPGDHLGPAERDPEAPPEDAVEQAIPADPVERPDEIHRGLEVGEYDAIEQARVVDLGDDAYR